jgi:hypothetical protein
MEYSHIDSAVFMAHQHRGPDLDPNQIGKFVGSNTTKIYALVDALGKPVTFMLTRHDGPVAQELPKEVALSGMNVVVDKAYGGHTIRYDKTTYVSRTFIYIAAILLITQ